MSSPFRENVRVSAWEEPFLTQKTEPFFLPACIPFSWGKGSHPSKPSLASGWPSQKVTLLSNTCKIFRVNRRLCGHRWYESMKWLFGLALWSLGGPPYLYPFMSHTVSMSSSFLISQLFHSSCPLISDYQAFWSLPLRVISLYAPLRKSSLPFKGT